MSDKPESSNPGGFVPLRPTAPPSGGPAQPPSSAPQPSSSTLGPTVSMPPPQKPITDPSQRTAPPQPATPLPQRPASAASAVPPRTEPVPRSAPPAADSSPTAKVPPLRGSVTARVASEDGAAGTEGSTKKLPALSGQSSKPAPKSGVPAEKKRRPVEQAKDKEPDAAKGFTMIKRPRAFTGCLTGFVYVIAIVLLSVAMGTQLWHWAADLLALQRDSDEPVELVYTEEMTIRDLSETLTELGIIEYPWLFRFYCDFSGAEEKIFPGTYMVAPSDYRAIIHSMNRNSEFRAQVKVTFREGLTMDQVLDLMVENQVSTRAELEEAAAVGNFNYEYLKNYPALPGRLEGYLYPNTHDFYINENPVSALRKLVSNFDQLYTAELRKRVEDSGYTLNEILTIASMIEMEASDDYDERREIAGVIYNRLKIDMELQIDATIQYALPERVQRVLAVHLEVDSPYNTYRNKGLPPGPICSPSKECIQAALNPKDSKYIFYLLNDDDETEFFTNHEAFANAKNSYDRYK